MRLLGYLAILALLFSWEIEMRILLIFSYRRALACSEDIFLNGARRILAIASCYWRIHFQITIPKAAQLPASFVLISNHQSYFDILILRAMFPQHRLRFVAKQSIRYGLPAVSILMRIQRHAFVSRSMSELWNDMQEMQELAERTSRQSALCPALFPEGTRSRQNRLGTFHYAAIWQLALKRQVPIVITSICNSHHLGKAVSSHYPPISVQAEMVEIMHPPYQRGQAKEISEEIRQKIAQSLQRQMRWKSTHRT